jgi:hypothetical protein
MLEPETAVITVFGNSSSLLETKVGQWVQRQATGWTDGIRFPAGERYFSLLRNIQTAYGAGQPASYPIGSGGTFPGGKGAGT